MKKILFVVLLTLVALSLKSQTISNDVSTGWNSNSSQGGSFTATITGYITEFDVRTHTAGSVNFLLYNGAIGSGTPGVKGTPAYEQPFLLTLTHPTGWDNIVLTTPFPIIAGNQYTYILESGGYLEMSNDQGVNSYAGGGLIYGYATAWGGYDAAFRVYETPPVPVSGWSIFLALSLVVTLIAVKFYKRNKSLQLN